MKRVAAHIVVAVPAELCVRAVQASIDDPRLLDAYGRLRSGKEYSGWVTVLEPGRRLEITFAALDPATGRRAHALGWRVTYYFTPVEDGRTRVEVGIEYSTLAAVAAGGTLRAQAENHIQHRLAALHALEFGLREAGAPQGAAAGALPRG
jgi:hypothetical protein